ncbi:UNVERIFIED_ORG: hypothetical protein ABID57_000666 [Arthrobacter sp. UYEF1]
MSEVTDWISASANVVAAVGTAGALWVGAVTLRRQVNDKHRQQAAAITVGNRIWKEQTDIGELKRGVLYFIRNNSTLPIYNVLLYAGPVEARRKDIRQVLAPGEEASFKMASSDFMAFAKFIDSSGVAWKRDGAGRIAEIKTGESFPWTLD